MQRFLSSVLKYVVYPTGRAFVLYGQLYVPIAPVLVMYAQTSAARRSPAVPPAEPGPPAWDGPPPCHPERLRPDLPLSAAETALLRQLDWTVK